MDPSNGTGNGPNDFSPNNINNNNYSLNNAGSSQLPQQSQQQGQAQQPQFQIPLPPNFDINSIPPAEREILLRRLQQQHQQQQQQFQLQQHQQQLQRARQAQAHNFQRMTMNAYGTPRPPLSSSQQQQPPNSTAPIPTQTFFINPMMNMSMPPVPMNMPMGAYHQNFTINRPPSMPQNSINPALLQPGGAIKPSLSNNDMQQITHINPQQFTNPLKSDPVLYSMNTANANPVPGSTIPVLNIPPFDEQIMNSEGSFVEHLIKFYDCIKFSNRVVPQIAQRSVSLFRLFQVVISAGGFVFVGENRKWSIVAQALQLPGNNYEVVAMVRAVYYTFLYAYEQYFIQKKPLDKIDWPNQSKQQPQVQAQMVQAQQPRLPTQQVPSQPQTPSPIATPFTPQNLKFIPENELYLWKSFADVMKVPIGPISDLDTAILYLNSPYLTLKIEALLAAQKLFAQASPKELQSAGFSSDSLTSLLQSLESLWSIEGLKRRKSSYKTMEEFWAETDNQKRDLLADRTDLNKNLIICRQIVSLIRTLIVTKGSEVGQFLSKSDFIKQKLLLFGLMETDDMELYKETLVIYESISPHLGNVDCKLLEWTLKQCEIELKQVRQERLTGLTVKTVGTLNLDRIGTVENLSNAKQTVSILISQCAQLWKSVPAHIFLHLSASLNVLTSSDTIDFELKSFCKEIEEFLEIFLFPSVALLRALRNFFENSLNFAVEELRKILETVIYSPIFSLTDGGFLEICLQLLCKCQTHQSDCLNDINWVGIYVLLRELREFWRHSECQQHVPFLAKTCYQNPMLSTGSSPAKKTIQNQKLDLAITNGSSNISSTCSHPFALLLKSLHLLVRNFASLPETQKFDLLQLVIEWNLGTPSQWGREVLGCFRVEEEIKILREHYF